MKRETFLLRLTSGKSLRHVYDAGALTGLVRIWTYEGFFVLTWEECPIGEQYDESTYTKDLREVFATPAEVLAYLSREGLSPESFTP